MKNQFRGAAAPQVRRGSIPLVLLIVIVLGIGAGAAIFGTMGTARLDKRSGLNDFAKMLAQSSVEEILVKITNNNADYTENSRMEYTPFATKEMARLMGFEVESVQVLGRLAEAPANTAQADEFLALMTVGPGFASPDVREAAFEDSGSNSNSSNSSNSTNSTNSSNSSNSTNSSSSGGVDPDLDWRSQPNLPSWMQAGTTEFDGVFYGLLSGEAGGSDGSDGGAPRDPVQYSMVEARDAGLEYHEGEWANYQDRDVSQFQDANRTVEGQRVPSVREAFWDLEPLPKLDWENDLFGVSHFSSDDVEFPSSEMQEFLDKWDVAMEAVARRVGERIEGCAGNPNYGVGAMISAIALGGSSDADSTAEEEFRETSEEGGLLDYQAYLVTVQGEASTRVGTVSVRKAVTAHRIVSRMRFKVAMDMLRRATVPYLMVHYNLTPRDLMLLGWIKEMTYQTSGTSTPDPGGDTLNQITVDKSLFTKLAEEYPDNPNPRVVPFQAATCLYKTGGF